MKKLAGLLMLLTLGYVANASAKAAPNVILDVQVSTNALPGAQVKGLVTSLGQSQVVSGTTNNQGRVSLGFNITVSSFVQPASFLVKGQGTDGLNFIQGRTNGNFQIIMGSPTTNVPIFLPLQ